MKAHLLHLSTLFIILNVEFCPSCIDKDEPQTVCTPANTIPVPQDMKDRFYFKTGTYWIYKNLATNETDSLWVFLNHLDVINADDNDYGFIKNKCYESFATSIKSSRINSYYYNAYSIQIYPREGQPQSELFGIEDFNLSSQRHVYRVKSRGGQYESDEGAEIEFIDSFNIQNTTHHDIMHLKYPAGTSTYDYLNDMYYAKNVGLVKFYRFADNSKWELIRSKIIQ